MKKIFGVLLVLTLSIINASDSPMYGKKDYERGLNMGRYAGKLAAEYNLPQKYKTFSKKQKNYYQGFRDGYVIGYNDTINEMMETGEWSYDISPEALADETNPTDNDDVDEQDFSFEEKVIDPNESYVE